MGEVDGSGTGGSVPGERADPRVSGAIAVMLRQVGADHPGWYLSESVGALLEAGVICAGPALAGVDAVSGEHQGQGQDPR